MAFGDLVEVQLPSRWDAVSTLLENLYVHPIGPRTWVLRQSLASHHEAPFMYLLRGQHRALLVDTGAGGLRLREAVDRLIGADFPLRVTNTHQHADHIQGNQELESRPRTMVLGTAVPDGESLDLGGRAIVAISTPGHHRDHLCFYDAELELLLTGDFLYAGRLYIEDAQAYLESLAKLEELARERTIRWMLGSHIEISRAGREFPEGACEHPDERVLELPPRALGQVASALASMGSTLVRRNCGEFVIVPT